MSTADENKVKPADDNTVGKTKQAEEGTPPKLAEKEQLGKDDKVSASAKSPETDKSTPKLEGKDGKETPHGQQHEDEERKMCGPCSKDETEVSEENHPYGVAYCSDCCEFLCEDCVKFHAKLKVTSSHRVVNIENLDDDVSSLDLLRTIESCPNHLKKNLEYFCRDHDYLCCAQCVIGAHRRCGHVTTLVKHAKSAKEDSKHDRLKHDVQRFRKYLNKIVSQDSENLESLETELTEVPRKLEEFRKVVTRTLEVLESRVKESAERDYCSEKATLSEHLDSSKMLQKALADAEGLLETAIQQGSDSQLFIATHVINRKMDDFEKSLRNISDTARTYRVDINVNEARLKSLEHALEVLKSKTDQDNGHFPKRRPLHERPPRPTPETFFSKRRGYEPALIE